MSDLQRARKSVAIFSGFVTTRRVGVYADLFRQKIAEGVPVRCVTRPPHRNGSMQKDGKVALQSLDEIGCIVDTRWRIHEKIVIIDDSIVWFGSLNPLSHTSVTEETMARIDNRNFANELTDALSLKHLKNRNGASVIKENPKCEDCNGRTAYYVGKYGKSNYWKCEDCGKNVSANRPMSGSNVKKARIKDRTYVGKPCKRKGCQGSVKIKTGRYGEFYACSNYPTCKTKPKIR